MVQLWVFPYSHKQLMIKQTKNRSWIFKINLEINKKNVTTKCFKDFNIRHKQTHSNFNVKKWEQKNMNKKTIINTIESIETNIYSAIYNNRFNFSGPNHIQTLINSSSNTTQKKRSQIQVRSLYFRKNPKTNSYCSLKSFFRTVWNHPVTQNRSSTNQPHRNAHTTHPHKFRAW